MLLAGSPTSILGGTYQGGSWTTTTLGSGTNAATSLTADASGHGIGAYAAAAGGTVTYTVWSGGAWQTPATVNASAVAKGQPFIDAAGGATAHLVYQDASFHFWYLGYTGGAWTSTPQAIGVAGDTFYGPVPAAIAARGADATIAFIDGEGSVNHAAEADVTSGVWQARSDPGGFGNFGISPAIIPLHSGPELLMAYVQCGDVGCTTNTTQIVFMTRTGGTWTSPAPIANCLTNDRLAVAPLPGGGAILAFRGTDTNLYWSVYSGGAWSTVAPFATPNLSVDGAPAVAHGVAGDTAEIAYVTGGVAYHARLSGGAWSAPVMVGGANLNGVAIAATP